MGEYLKKLTVATAISLLSLGTIEASKANSATLLIGQYGSWLNSRQLLNSVPRNDLLNSTVVGRRLLSDNSNYSQIATANNNLNSAIDKNTSTANNNLNSAIDQNRATTTNKIILILKSKISYSSNSWKNN